MSSGQCNRSRRYRPCCILEDDPDLASLHAAPAVYRGPEAAVRRAPAFGTLPIRSRGWSSSALRTWRSGFSPLRDPVTTRSRKLQVRWALTPPPSTPVPGRSSSSARGSTLSATVPKGVPRLRGRSPGHTVLTAASRRRHAGPRRFRARCWALRHTGLRRDAPTVFVGRTSTRRVHRVLGEILTAPARTLILSIVTPDAASRLPSTRSAGWSTGSCASSTSPSAGRRTERAGAYAAIATGLVLKSRPRWISVTSSFR